MEFVNWVTAHWVEITAAVTAVVLAADKIAALTPTIWDDNALAWAKRILNVVALQKPSTGVVKTDA